MSVEVSFTDKELRTWCNKWKNSPVVKLMEKRVHFKVPKNKLRTWTKNGAIVDVQDDYYLVQFDHVEDYKFTLYEGPWRVAEHYLIVQR